MNHPSLMAVIHGLNKLSKPASTSKFIYVLVLANDIQKTAIFSIFHNNINPRNILKA